MTDPITASRLEFLEGAVATLLKSRRRPHLDTEALTPNYLTIDPVTGKISANFNGVVTGSLTLPEGTTSPPALGNIVQWIDSTNTLQEWIGGLLLSPGRHQLKMVLGSLGSGVSFVIDGGGPNGPRHVFSTGVPVIVLLDSIGNSSFPLCQGGPRIQNIGQPATAYRNAAGLTSVVGNFLLNLDTVDSDPGGHFSGSPLVFTCPVAGQYMVVGQVTITATAAAQQSVARIFKNGLAGTSYQGSISWAGAAGPMETNISRIITCAANDTLQLGASCGTAGLAVPTTAGLTNYMSVIQVA